MKALKIIGRILLVLLITVVFLLVAAVGITFIMEKGPSETAKVLFVRSVNETSRMGFVSRIFLSEEEVEDIMDKSSMKDIDEGVLPDMEMVVIDEETVTDEIELVDVSGSSFKGKMLIIHDPSRVFCGVVPEFGHFDGMNVMDIISTYQAKGYNIAGGINGGDFIDNGVNSSFTAQPLGVVISEGEVVWADDTDDSIPYHLAGFDNDNRFIMGYITLKEARDLGIRDAIYCVHETGPFLVMNGEALIDEVPDSATYGGGKNPRTAIGQREDGAVLMMVVDGRQANSLGATFKDMAYAMLEYGAVNACCMDGGTSSQLIYEGAIQNHPYSPFGPRKCPTAWLVKY